MSEETKVRYVIKGGGGYLGEDLCWVPARERAGIYDSVAATLTAVQRYGDMAEGDCPTLRLFRLIEEQVPERRELVPLRGTVDHEGLVYTTRCPDGTFPNRNWVGRTWVADLSEAVLHGTIEAACQSGTVVGVRVTPAHTITREEEVI